jgi:hypothetical protein
MAIENVVVAGQQMQQIRKSVILSDERQVILRMTRQIIDTELVIWF